MALVPQAAGDWPTAPACPRFGQSPRPKAGPGSRSSPHPPIAFDKGLAPRCARALGCLSRCDLAMLKMRLYAWAIVAAAIDIPVVPAQAQKQATILYDAFGPSSALKMDWGFAALIQYGGRQSCKTCPTPA